MTIRHCIRLSVQEQVYFDTVIHALGWDRDERSAIMQEADTTGRRDCTDPAVRDIFRCMDLGLSPRECYHYMAGIKPAPEAHLFWGI